jgi:hypothetical protein
VRELLHECGLHARTPSMGQYSLSERLDINHHIRVIRVKVARVLRYDDRDKVAVHRKIALDGR